MASPTYSPLAVTVAPTTKAAEVPSPPDDAWNCTLYGSLLFQGNISFSDYPRQCFRYSDASRVIIGLILGLLAIGTAIGNALVILAVGLVKKLQTPSNLLIVSLAVSDFSVSLMVLPFAAIKTLAEGMWPLSHRICDLFIIFDVLLCTSSILNLCAISIDRYLVITRPFNYAPKRTPTRMGLMILVAWLGSALISIPPVIGWKKSQLPGQCEISDDLGYQIYATFGAFYLPLIVMLVLYGRIFKLAREMAQADAKHKPTLCHPLPTAVVGGDGATVRLNSGDGELPNGATAQQQAGVDQRSSLSDHFPARRQRQAAAGGTRAGQARRKSKGNSETKAIKTLGVIMGCFTLCWLPFFIMQLMNPIVVVAQVKNFSIPGDLVGVFVWLGYANSFLNPIIYAKFNRDFRTPFKEILMFRCGSINARLRSESYAEQYGLPMHTVRRDSRSARRKSSDLVTKVNRKGKVTNSLGNGTSTEHV